MIKYNKEKQQMLSIKTLEQLNIFVLLFEKWPIITLDTLDLV